MKEEVIKVLPTTDMLFKKLFTSPDSTHILKAFVRDILGKEFKSLKPRETYYIDSYKRAFNADPELMRTEVDILAETEDGSHVTIEMQVQPHDYFIERAVFYLGEAYRSSLGNQEIEDFISSNNFSALRPTYGINIVDFHLFDKEGPATRRFGVVDLDTNEILQSSQGEDLIIISFFSLINKNVDRNSPAYHWQQFFKTGKVADDAPDYLKDAQKKVNFYSLEEDEREMIMEMNKSKMINDAVMATVDRKAEERGKIEVALNLLEEGLPIDLIAKTTGFSVEQIKKLRNN